MANILFIEQSQVMVGLGTVTFTIPSTGIYNVKCQVTENPASSLTVVVNDNGSPIYTAPVETPTQSAFQFKHSFTAIAGHVITVVFASGAAIDNKLNTVKSITSIGVGQ